MTDPEYGTRQENTSSVAKEIGGRDSGCMPTGSQHVQITTELQVDREEWNSPGKSQQAETTCLPKMASPEREVTASQASNFPSIEAADDSLPKNHPLLQSAQQLLHKQLAETKYAVQAEMRERQNQLKVSLSSFNWQAKQ